MRDVHFLASRMGALAGLAALPDLNRIAAISDRIVINQIDTVRDAALDVPVSRRDWFAPNRQRYTTPHTTNGLRERTRRLRQIVAGSLRAENGLAA